MVTALLLQLIQCVVKLPRPDKDDKNLEESGETEKRRKEREAAERVSEVVNATLCGGRIQGNKVSINVKLEFVICVTFDQESCNS